MSHEASLAHWQRIHSERQPTEVSWYQRTPATSLDLVKAARIGKDIPIVDVGAGASTLVDGLLERGYREIYLLDIADAAFASTRRRLGARASHVQTIAADVAAWRPVHTFGLWHDRALFHFMTEPSQRDAYRETLRAALAPTGKAIVATFADDGPSKCSGLPVVRYSPEGLAFEFNGLLTPLESRREQHTTPGGATQSFVYTLFERT
ncbi:MAG TPA: class I SAM-dependent methyltransferase [Polyangiaceae bacterium]